MSPAVSVGHEAEGHQHNGKSTTVTVASVCDGCALPDNAAFEQIRKPGTCLIRRAPIEKAG